MKVMVFVKASKESEAGEMPSQQLLEEMGKFNEELVNAGIMLAGEGLQPSSKGARVRFSGTKRAVIDGPFAETKELVAGFWMWQVKSMAEAIDWVKRCPNPMLSDSEIEIRPVFELEDFGDAVTPEFKERSDRLQQQVDKLVQGQGAKLAEPRYENGRELLIAGLKQRYGNETRTQIPSLWARFAPHIGKVPSQKGKVTYGVTWNDDAQCNFDYMAGVEVSDTSGLPKEFSHLRIAPVRYAVFEHQGHVSSIAQTLDAIWTKWLPNSGHKGACTPCFERYTEEFDPKTNMGGIEIWVPIES